ncbi:MAG TPA: RodZ domain-containing protein [Candidatus Elarobacter sp.]|jgi:transcriptional regulator with XRE-family HTH domain
MPALGEEFRSAREARGLTLSDVAEQIHIRSVYLNAIENEDWKAIGAPVYVRGFIRTYARFLALDGEDAIARFNAAAPQERPPASAVLADFEDENERSGPSLWVLLGGLVAVALVAFVVYEYWQYAKGGDRPVPVAVATPAAQPATASAGSQAPVASAAPKATPAAGAHHQLAIRLTQRSWLRVSVDGVTKLEGIYPAGTARTFTGTAADVRAGNAGGVSVGVNGRPPAPMGKEGDVVEQRYPL